MTDMSDTKRCWSKWMRVLRRGLATGTATAILVLLRPPSITMAEPLARLSMDDAATIGTTIQTDASVKTEGQGSIKITTLHPTTICLGQVLGLDVEEATLIYTAKVKSALDGTAFLEMWAHVDGGRYFARGLNDTVEGRRDWKSIQVPFRFQKGQRPDKVVVNIVVNGTGTVWVDDLRLAKAPLDGERHRD